MTLRYMLDTNTALQVMKGEPAKLRERLVKTPLEQVGISAVTEGELRFGIERARETRDSMHRDVNHVVEEFLARVERVPWDSEAARSYGKLREVCERALIPLGNFDMMIAAHAQSRGLVLVTPDRMLPHVPGLKVEDWRG
jgi:tRNA(fMet)-specific endonuclease VapC